MKVKSNNDIHLNIFETSFLTLFIPDRCLTLKYVQSSVYVSYCACNKTNPNCLCVVVCEILFSNAPTCLMYLVDQCLIWNVCVYICIVCNKKKWRGKKNLLFEFRFVRSFMCFFFCVFLYVICVWFLFLVRIYLFF